MQPPPGMQSQQPQQPAMPNAHDDPFGAMNAMAHAGTVQRAPEIVIVNDGRPVEDVSAGSRGAAIAKLALPAIAALAIGLGIGRISKDADFYNEGLRGSRAIAPGVHDTKKLLSDLDTQLEEAKAKNFKPDAALDKMLSSMAGKLDIKTDVIYRAKENDPEIAGSLMSFYAGVNEVKSMLDIHGKSAAMDDMAIKAGQKKADDAKVKDTENANLAAAGQLRYAIVMSAPTEQDKTDFGARFVELGPPYCGDAKLPTTTGKCNEGEQVSGYAYRTEPGSGWTKGDIAANGSDSVPTKKLVLLLSNGVLDSVVKGTDAGASEALYEHRLKAISERTKKLIEDGNKLESALQVESSKGNRFSFFL